VLAAEPHVITDAAAPRASLGSHYGYCADHAAYAREVSPGCWQVKVHDPRHRDAGIDGWRIASTGSPDLAAAAAASGFSKA
jgi:hypothetical protein